MTPPYALRHTCCVGAEEVQTGDDLEALLRERDERNNRANFRRETYDVVDLDDAEKGTAEWCEECGERGTFGYECEVCGGA